MINSKGPSQSNGPGQSNRQGGSAEKNTSIEVHTLLNRPDEDGKESTGLRTHDRVMEEYEHRKERRERLQREREKEEDCLLYTSDAADES